MLKTAVFIPSPTARVATTTAVNPGVLRSARRACRTSCSEAFPSGPTPGLGTGDLHRGAIAELAARGEARRLRRSSRARADGCARSSRCRRISSSRSLANSSRCNRYLIRLVRSRIDMTNSSSPRRHAGDRMRAIAMCHPAIPGEFPLQMGSALAAWSGSSVRAGSPPSFPNRPRSTPSPACVAAQGRAIPPPPAARRRRSVGSIRRSQTRAAACPAPGSGESACRVFPGGISSRCPRIT